MEIEVKFQMNLSKLEKYEAVFLIVNIIIAHVILNLPKDLFTVTRNSYTY